MLEQTTDVVHVIGRRMRRAILGCYRELPYKAPWSFYSRNVLLSTVAPQTTGTVAYVASTRTVTLTGATWPSNVVDYVLRIDGVQCRVESRTSSTVIILAEGTAPAANIAAGASYSLFRAIYTLPEEWRNIQTIRDIDSGWSLEIAEPNEVHWDSTGIYDSPGEPRKVSIAQRQAGLGQLGLQFTPPPSAVRRYSITIDAVPRPLSLENFASTATLSANTSTVTIDSGDVLPTRLIGCVARFSLSATEPTGTAGANPYKFQRKIISRTDATHFVVDEAIDTALVGYGMTISDPIDIEPGAMLTAFQRMIEYEFALLSEFEGLSRREALVTAALQQAIGNDLRHFRGGAARRSVNTVRYGTIGPAP